MPKAKQANPESKRAPAKRTKKVVEEAEPPFKKQRGDGEEVPDEGSASSDSHQVLMLAATKL